MMYFSRLRQTLILALCLVGVLLCIPNFAAAPSPGVPWRRVHLGLDLSGGSYLLMQVDLGAARRERLANLVDQVRRALAARGIFYLGLGADPAHERVGFTLRDPSQRDAALAALRTIPQDIPGEFTVVTGPGEALGLSLSATALAARAREEVGQSIEIVRRRLDGTGVVDPSITRQGDDRIVVELPGIGDPEHVKELLGRTAKMTFHLLDAQATDQASPPPGVTFLPMQDNPKQMLPVERYVEVDGSDLTDAEAGQDPQTGQWVVNFTFNGTGAERFADTTRNNVGRPFAIVLDNQVISAPVIREPILGGRGQISGSFSAQQATDLALLLRAGALPAPLTVVEQRSVGPELGADSIRAGILSLLVGFLLVVGFMGSFYGLFGWFANAALVVNLVLMLAILSLFQATLTLPGMAGLLLTLGMAVDANILINERIREEVRNGRTPLNAMEAGCRRAYATIIDSNVTALLAHVMLFVFGSGPVRGFALTITIGIVTSLFANTLLVRLLMVRWYARRRPALLPV